MHKLIERKVYLDQLAMWRGKDMIKVVTGVCRCGKSTLLELYIEKLKSDGLTDDQIIFVNLEGEDFSELLDYKKLHEYLKSRIHKNQWTHVFIDEIQNCKEYKRAVSSLYLRKNVDIYITGSNAYMLPLSFNEYSETVDIADKREDLHDITLVKSIASFLASNIRSPVSAKKIADTLTSNGRPTSSATVDTYLNAITDACLFYNTKP